ncbi:MAG: hypothetical protein U1F61_23430 [Opitutaceae bacterium]
MTQVAHLHVSNAQRSTRIDIEAMGGGAVRVLWVSPSPTVDEELSSKPQERMTEEQRLRRKGAVTVVAQHPELGYRSFAVPGDESGSPEPVARFEAQQLLEGASGKVWDVMVWPARRGKCEVLLISAPLTPIEQTCEEIESTGARVERVLDVATSLAGSFRFVYGREPEAVLVVRIGSRTTHLVLIESDRFQARVVPVGGDQVTHALATDLRLPPLEAELLKRQLAASTEEDRARQPEPCLALARATGGLAGRLQLEITRFLVNQREPGGNATTVPILLCGGGACLPGLREALEARLKLPVDTFETRDRVQWEPAVPAGKIERLRAPAWLGAAVVALQQVELWPRISLLPPARAQARAARRRQATWAGAAALVALAGLPPTWHFQRLAREAETNVRALDAEVQRLQSLVTRNREAIARIEAARGRLAVLRDLTSARRRWPRFLAELQSCLEAVQDAWLDSLQLDRAPAGEGGLPLRFRLAGRLLDDPNETVAIGPESERRVRALLTRLERSPAVARVERERFERLEPGVLRFEVVLAVAGDRIQ